MFRIEVIGEEFFGRFAFLLGLSFVSVCGVVTFEMFVPVNILGKFGDFLTMNILGKFGDFLTRNILGKFGDFLTLGFSHNTF